MKRNINSTGRQKITHQMVSFDIARTPTGESKSFTANLSGLRELKLPATAHISIEAYLGHSSMRFDFGTVGAIIPPTDTLLSEIDRGGEINFRIKITNNEDAGHLGRLLASGDRLSAASPGIVGDGQLPLLPVRHEALGEIVWDVSTSNGERPYLLINSRIKGLSARLQDDALLRASILIEAFRKVLWAMLENTQEDEPTWFQDWKIYLATVLLVPLPDEFINSGDDDEGKEDFVRDAVTAFSNKFQFATRALPHNNTETSDE